MQQFKVGICEIENNYMLGLMAQINSDMSNCFIAIAFSAKEALMEYLETGTLDLLMVPEGFRLDATDRDSYGGRLIYMTDESIVEPEPGYISIYKYQKVSSIIKTLNSIIVGSENTLKDKLYKVYAVVSPVGRSGKTKLAMALCSNDEVRGGLYIGCEEYGYRDVNTMADIMFLVKSRSDGLVDFLEGSVETVEGSNMGMIRSALSYQDIREMEREDFSWFIDRLVEWGRYTTIVFDIGGGALSDVEIFRCFHRIFMPVLNDTISIRKLDAFDAMLERKHMDKTRRAITRVNVPDCEFEEPEMLRLVDGLNV